jgi:hypothetical protein
MLESAIKVNSFLTGYCRRLMADIPDERMTEQPLPGVNHPAWILGHLAVTADFAAASLGAEKTLPREWGPLFGPGSKLSATRSTYPSKDELLGTLEQRFEVAREKAAVATLEQLSKPSTNARTKDALPTIQDGITFLLTGHFGGHLGQLSAWRRMIGMPPMF